MQSLILPSKHGGYPGFRSGKLTQANYDLEYADIERHMRSVGKCLWPPIVLSACVVMVLFSLLKLADSAIEDKRSDEFQTVMFLCFLSVVCHLSVIFVSSRAHFLAGQYSTTRVADRLSVAEYQMQLEALNRCSLVLEWIQCGGLVLFGLSAVYTFYLVLVH